MTVRRVTAAEAVAVHDAAIRMFGGAGGVRDEGALESTLAQPFQAFGGEDLYPGVADKAARLCYGIVAGYPFVDGNKRTGAALLGAFLRANGVAFAPPHREFLDAILRVASGEAGYGEFAAWVRSQAR